MVDHASNGRALTDHKALLSIMDGSLAKDSPNDARSARIDRWQLRLAEYNLKFQHIPGTENKITDGLSRLPVSAMEVRVAGKEEELVEALVVEETEEIEAGVDVRKQDAVMHTSRVSSARYSASRVFFCLETASLYSSPTRFTRVLTQLIFHCATVFYAPRRHSRLLARRPHSPTTLDSPRARLAASCASLAG
jgi:hypothetical protein